MGEAAGAVAVDEAEPLLDHVVQRLRQRHRRQPQLALRGPLACPVVRVLGAARLLHLARAHRAACLAALTCENVIIESCSHSPGSLSMLYRFTHCKGERAQERKHSVAVSCLQARVEAKWMVR